MNIFNGIDDKEGENKQIIKQEPGPIYPTGHYGIGPGYRSLVKTYMVVIHFTKLAPGRKSLNQSHILMIENIIQLLEVYLNRAPFSTRVEPGSHPVLNIYVDDVMGFSY